MLIEGEADLRTPPTAGGEQMFRALKYLKKPAVMVRFPGETPRAFALRRALAPRRAPAAHCRLVRSIPPGCKRRIRRKVASMIHAAIDHLVVTAPSLEMGVAYVRGELEVVMQSGGKHARMGTHNALLKLDQMTYLEVLAINPKAHAPDYPRWFGLETASEPRLSAWVARVNDIAAARAASAIAFGDVKEMSRGDLKWLITIPADGKLPYHGVAPMLIQWLSGPHPAQRIPDSGCSLARLRGVHADAVRMGRGAWTHSIWTCGGRWRPRSGHCRMALSPPLIPRTGQDCSAPRAPGSIYWNRCRNLKETINGCNSSDRNEHMARGSQDGNGSIDSTSGVLKNTPFTFATRFENSPGTNPEELIAAAHAACYSMAFSNYLSTQGYVPDTITVKATCSLEDGKIGKMHLEARGKVDGVDNATFKRLADEAEKKCPVSNLLRPGLAISLDASLL